MRAADGAAMAHGGIAEHRGQMHDRGDRLLDIGALRDVVIGRRGLDRQGVAETSMPINSLIFAEIDDVGGRGQPLLHDRDQRVTAGEIFRLRTLGEQGRGFVDRGGAMVCASRTWMLSCE